VKKTEDKIVLSASDLVGHLNCRFLTKLDYEFASGLRAPPKDDSLHVEAIRRLGYAHEERFVAHLQEQFGRVETVDNGPITNATVARTIELMQSGVDIIVQAAFDNGLWRGKADILRKIKGKVSRLGDWSYEVMDTKLASETKGGTVLQLCLYAEFIQDIQGELPEYLYVVPRALEFEEQVYRTRDYLAYFNKVKKSIESAVTAKSFDDLYPDPVSHCDVCRWSFECDKRRHQDDHLSLVAGATKLQIIELKNHKVQTVGELAAMPTPLQWKPERGGEESLVKIREQARVQVEGRKAGKVIHELLEIDEDFGLGQLPEPSKGDIFLDLEGDPFAGYKGLEYLFGYVYAGDGGNLQYEAIWAYNPEEEKAAFERFMDFAIQRFEQYPDLHIYHYAPYEPAALKRLMGRYAVKENELDRFLRGLRFIDLYSVVRRTLRASVESYSIKKLEPLFNFRRQQDLKIASQNRASLEMALESDAIGSISNEEKQIVLAYNRDDCFSTVALRLWLEEERRKLIESGISIFRPPLVAGDAGQDLQEKQAKNQQLYERLAHDIPADSKLRTADQQSRWLMANMLDWHWREQKVALWEKFRLMEMNAEELLDEPAAISGLEFGQSYVNQTGKNVFRYLMPLQETDIRIGSPIYNMLGKEVSEVSDISLDEGWVDFNNQIIFDHDISPSVFTLEILPKNAVELPIKAIARIAEDISQHGFENRNKYATARSLLLNENPLYEDVQVRGDDETSLTAACRVVSGLNGKVLSIQGPPGTGKSFTAAHMICTLIRQGKRVGITATSHKVIRSLVDKVFEISAKQNENFRCVMRSENDQRSSANVQEIRMVPAKSNADILKQFNRSQAPLIAATIYFWSREDVQELVDVLFVDEAAQMSLANVIAASQGAKALVLIGDPQQLEQPTKASHPEGTDVSSLDHVRGESELISNDRGIFLEDTYRLNPDICSFTSEIFYQGRLLSVSGCEKQIVTGETRLSGSGLKYLPVSHIGNRNSSPEEVDVIESLVDECINAGLTYTDRENKTHPVTFNEILIVAPYNAQVAELRKRMPNARIGTVDKFQGQEAAIVIYSMASSSPADAPRGMEFLYSLNRLNVATSRAKCLAVIVGSPDLFEASCRTPRQIQLANAFCRYLEVAAIIPPLN